MKSSVITLFMTVLLGFTAYANSNEAYIQAMTTAIGKYDSAESLEEFQQIANTFERITQRETEEYLPRYYAALTYVFMSFNRTLENDERDAYLDKAQGFADQAEEITGESSEMYVLMGYIKMAKLSVNPAIRGMVLTPAVNKLFGKARELDPNNPRAAIMLARMKYGTAQFFNSSTEESCELASESLNLYDKESDRGIEPHWGRGIAESMAKQCSETK